MDDERKAREEAGPSVSHETEEKIKQLTDQVRIFRKWISMCVSNLSQQVWTQNQVQK